MAKTLRVGMIGYRFMGKAHSNAWRQAPHFFPLKADVELHTICGRDAGGVEAARKQFGWEYASTDWREVINSPEIDIVDINTPNDSHAEIAIAACRAGKHVLCEKPLALTVKQCEAMVAAAKKAKVVNMVCHNYRRIPAIATPISNPTDLPGRAPGGGRNPGSIFTRTRSTGTSSATGPSSHSVRTSATRADAVIRAMRTKIA